MNQLNSLLFQLENQIPNLEKRNTKVSKSTVGWQINHCLLVIYGIIAQLEKSNPEEFKQKFNFWKFIIFITKRIPRGKARAPKMVNPVVETTIEDLKEKVEVAKNSILKLSNLPKNAFFSHPYFGNLNKTQTEKFLRIHTKHHLKIINDILK